MRSTHRLIGGLRSVCRRQRVESELDAELQFHLDQQIREHIDAGMAEGEARVAAGRSLGGAVLVKERCRDSLGLTWLDDLRLDIRYALRGLVADRGFSIASILMLAIAIGANT